MMCYEDETLEIEKQKKTIRRLFNKASKLILEYQLINSWDSEKNDLHLEINTIGHTIRFCVSNRNCETLVEITIRSIDRISRRRDILYGIEVIEKLNEIISIIKVELKNR